MKRILILTALQRAGGNLPGEYSCVRRQTISIWRLAVALYWVIVLAFATTAWTAVMPMAEAEQATRAWAILDAYHGQHPATPPKLLHVAYYTPADRQAADNYPARLEAILEDIRAFYGDEMKRLGFGPKTFTLARDAKGKLIIHFVKGTEPESTFTTWSERKGSTGSPESGTKVKRACQKVLETAGIDYSRETVLIFSHLATYDEKAGTFRHHAPYFGSWNQQSGLCFVADWSNQKLDNLTAKTPMLNDGEYGNMSLGKHTTIFLGGIAHELGHAFALPHCGERWDEKARGTSLMGGGNHTYREERRGAGKGSFLTMASAMHLAGRPLFNGSAKGMTEPARLLQCDLVLSTNLVRTDYVGRRGGLRVEGRVVGTLPVYGVIAYFDSIHDGGYRAPTATSVPDAQGQFAMEVTDLARCQHGTLRVEFCHVNGAVSERTMTFSVGANGQMDISAWVIRQAVGPVADAVGHNQIEAARKALRDLEAGQVPELARQISRKLVNTLEKNTAIKPAAVPDNITQLYLGDAQPTVAEVGWLIPGLNRVPANADGVPPYLDSGELYATGLYGHAPARYIFDMDGKWKELSGAAGLHTLHQAYGSVVFIIKADGREVYRSAIIKGTKQAIYKVPVTKVKQIELIVDPGEDGKSNDWGLWLDPVLKR